MQDISRLLDDVSELLLVLLGVGDQLELTARDEVQVLGGVALTQQHLVVRQPMTHHRQRDASLPLLRPAPINTTQTSLDCVNTAKKTLNSVIQDSTLHQLKHSTRTHTGTHAPQTYSHRTLYTYLENVRLLIYRTYT